MEHRGQLLDGIAGQLKGKAEDVKKRTQTLLSENLALEASKAGTKEWGNKGVFICKLVCFFFFKTKELVRRRCAKGE